MSTLQLPRAVHHRWPRSIAGRIAAAGLLACALAVFAACGTDESNSPDVQDGQGGEAPPAATPAAPEPTLTPIASPSPPPADAIGATGAAAVTPVPGTATELQQRLRTHLLSSLATQADPTAVRGALDEIEVVSLALDGLEEEDRDLWVAVTSGSGIWSLPDERVHVAAVYELRSDETWVEVSQLPLASAPTLADLEIVSRSHAGAAWVAVHGFTGAHSGTFELLRFDGVSLTSTLWWFSPTPGAGSVEDLDGDGLPEIVLNTTDPYVYCYACGVRAWDELIYRWVDGDLTEVAIASVPHASQIVVDATEQAAAFARADLWRRALESATVALQAAADNADVAWLHLAIQRVADARLADVGADQQPLMTSVLAGEYETAADLMRAHPPEEALSATGPLIAGTVAGEGWEDVTGEYLLDYASRAIEVDSSLAAAYAVRAFGRLLTDPEGWGAALLDMEQALQLEPGDAFYGDAVEYLSGRNSGASG